MAVERVETKKKQHKLTKDQDDQLKERRRTEEAAIETAFRQIYPSVWLPRIGSDGTIELEKIEVGGRPLQATSVHERVMELLTAVGGKPKLFGTLVPLKIVDRMKLGEPLAKGEPPRLGISTRDVCDAFFGFLEPPRISSDTVLCKSVARGVSEGMFGYCNGKPSLGADGKFEVAVSKVAFNRTMADDEIDLDNGFLIAPIAMPLSPPPTHVAETGGGVTAPATGGEVPAGSGTGVVTGGADAGPAVRTGVRITFPASRDDVFKSFQAIANLADKSDGGKIKITIDGHSASGYDPNWLRNAVEEPLDEASIEGLEIT
jgi:hypothetical protein